MSPDLSSRATAPHEAAAALGLTDSNNALFAKLYDELHRIARREVAR